MDTELSWAFTWHHFRDLSHREAYNMRLYLMRCRPHVLLNRQFDLGAVRVRLLSGPTLFWTGSARPPLPHGPRQQGPRPGPPMPVLDQGRPRSPRPRREKRPRVDLAEDAAGDLDQDHGGDDETFDPTVVARADGGDEVAGEGDEDPSRPT